MQLGRYVPQAVTGGCDSTTLVGNVSLSPVVYDSMEGGSSSQKVPRMGTRALGCSCMNGTVMGSVAMKAVMISRGRGA